MPGICYASLHVDSEMSLPSTDGMPGCITEETWLERACVPVGSKLSVAFREPLLQMLPSCSGIFAPAAEPDCSSLAHSRKV